MEVRIDQAGHRNQAGGVNDLRARRQEIRSNGRDRRALDQDVGLGVLRIRRIQREDAGTANDRCHPSRGPVNRLPQRLPGEVGSPISRSDSHTQAETES
jgi:hypothetical protein